MQVLPLRVEVWALAVDDFGAYLVSGDQAWAAGMPVQVGGSPDLDAEDLLREYDVWQQTLYLHPSHFRMTRDGLVVAYTVMLRTSGPVRNRWSQAVSLAAVQTGAVALPGRDVLLTGVGYLRWMLDNEPDFLALLRGAGVETVWAKQLRRFAPALPAAALAGPDCAGPAQAHAA